MSESLGADDWIDAALLALGTGGPQAIAIEPLARQLGVTKGSFYWHFADREALYEAIVDRWAARTEALVLEVSAIADPRAKLTALVAGAHRSEASARSMRAMSLLAERPKLGARVKAVARRRHGFLVECFAALGLGNVRAQAAARLLHAAYVGTGELDVLGVGPATGAEWKAYVEATMALTLALAGAKSPAK